MIRFKASADKKFHRHTQAQNNNRFSLVLKAIKLRKTLVEKD